MLNWLPSNVAACQVRGKLTREKTLEKIWREVDMLTRLQRCKGAVRLLGCFEDANHVMLVMELCTGGDLQQYVDVSAAGCAVPAPQTIARL